MTPRPSPSDFGPADLVDLLGVPFSEEQLDAITAPMEPYVVVAGAGSGKTTVMTARVVWLVGDRAGAARAGARAHVHHQGGGRAVRSGAPCRAAARRPDRPGSRSTRSASRPSSTYHAFAGRLLAEHGLRIGVEPGSRLLAEAASVQLAHRVVDAHEPRPVRVSARPSRSVVEYVRALDSELAEHCLDPDATCARWDDAWVAADRRARRRRRRTRARMREVSRDAHRARPPRRRAPRGARRARPRRLLRPDALRRAARRASAPRSAPRCASSTPSCCSTSTRTPPSPSA